MCAAEPRSAPLGGALARSALGRTLRLRGLLRGLATTCGLALRGRLLRSLLRRLATSGLALGGRLLGRLLRRLATTSGLALRRRLLRGLATSRLLGGRLLRGLAARCLALRRGLP